LTHTLFFFKTFFRRPALPVYGDQKLFFPLPLRGPPPPRADEVLRLLDFFSIKRRRMVSLDLNVPPLRPFFPSSIEPFFRCPNHELLRRGQGPVVAHRTSGATIGWDSSSGLMFLNLPSEFFWPVFFSYHLQRWLWDFLYFVIFFWTGFGGAGLLPAFFPPVPFGNIQSSPGGLLPSLCVDKSSYFGS